MVSTSYLLNPLVWRFVKGGSVTYTCHTYGDDGCHCSTCDGARCCDDEGNNYPRISTTSDSIYLITDQVYGDSFTDLPKEISVRELVDSIRSGDGSCGSMELEYSIDLPLNNYQRKIYGDKASRFFDALYELYKIKES